jgi:hypothetical protein
MRDSILLNRHTKHTNNKNKNKQKRTQNTLPVPQQPPQFAPLMCERFCFFLFLSFVAFHFLFFPDTVDLDQVAGDLSSLTEKCDGLQQHVGVAVRFVEWFSERG